MTDDGALSSLRALGIHVHVGAGYVLRAEEGWHVAFAGVPLSTREEYSLGSHVIPATFLDLRAEGDSRGYLLRVYDVRALPVEKREELRAHAEEHLLAMGRVTQPRTAHEGGAEVHDFVITELANNPEHDAMVRTFVLGDFVFEAVVIAEHGSGAPADARQFFASIGLEAQPPDVSR